MSLAAFLPGFGNQPGEVGFGKAELAGAGLAPFNEPPPAPVFQINLKRLPDQLVGGAVIFLGRGAYFRQQAWRDKGIGCGFGFHEIQGSIAR
jgi:hypothetical protein